MRIEKPTSGAAFDRLCIPSGCGWRRQLAGCILVLLCSAALFAQQDEMAAVPNRPTVSTTAQPVQRGVLETEWGVDAAASHQDLNGLFKFGLTTNLELRFANNPFAADSGTHGFGDTSLGFKYRFTQDSGSRPSIALMYMLKVPTAGDVLGSGDVDHNLLLLVSKDLGKHHFDYNLGAMFLGRAGGGCDHALLNALAWSHPLHGQWSVNAELSGVSSPNSATPGSAQFIAAAIYTARPRLVFDIGMMGRLGGEIPHSMFMAGVTYSIANLYGTRKKNDFLSTAAAVH
jgi:Putative MetA-pathway of phenol degradation